MGDNPDTDTPTGTGDVRGSGSDSESDLATLKQRIKAMMVENLMLQVGVDDIGDRQPLFGPGSLGLDSVDALQIVVGLEKHFGFKVPDAAAAREILRDVETMAAAVANHRAG